MPASSRALTGLGNRRALEEALAHEATRAARTDERVGVLLVDVDRFKSINDVHGHAAGDACLRVVAEALLGAVRAADSCFRWGGDEFVVLLPATDLAATREAAARAAASVADGRAPDGTPMSASIGCAELLGDMRSTRSSRLRTRTCSPPRPRGGQPHELIVRVAIMCSIDSAGTGGANRKPCARSQSSCISSASCSRFSTPSATTVSPSARAMPMMAVTIALSSSSAPRPSMKERSILSASSGKRRSS